MRRPTLARICVYTNCILYGVIILTLFGGILQRANDPAWQTPDMHPIQWMYTLTFSGVIIITAILIFALMRGKPWGRTLVTVWNIVIGLLLVGLPLFRYYLLVSLCGKPPCELRQFDLATIVQLLFGLVLILLAIFYWRDSFGRRGTGDSNGFSAQ